MRFTPATKLLLLGATVAVAQRFSDPDLDSYDRAVYRRFADAEDDYDTILAYRSLLADSLDQDEYRDFDRRQDGFGDLDQEYGNLYAREAFDDYDPDFDELYAREPIIQHLTAALKALGAKLSGQGSFKQTYLDARVQTKNTDAQVAAAKAAALRVSKQEQAGTGPNSAASSQSPQVGTDSAADLSGPPAGTGA